MKVFAITLGCKVNQYETQVMLANMQEAGFTVSEHVEGNDVVIINSCSFLASATSESIETTLQLAEEVSDGIRNAPIVMCGCVPSRYGSDLPNELPEVAAFVRTDEEDGIVAVVDEVTGTVRSGTAMLPSIKRTVEGTVAYLKISDGCDRFCSFCAIPYIRGRYHSRSAVSILEEAKSLVAGGVRELVLIGQDTGIWGEDFDQTVEGPHTLAELLIELAEAVRPEPVWIRVLYLQPEGMTDELIATIRDTPEVLPYIDIPVQHCCERVLSAMNRSGSEEELEALFARLRREIPDMVIRTTYLTAFPGETEDEVDAMLDFMDRVGFDYTSVFPYSPEEGTRACEMPDQIDETTKVERTQRAIDLAESLGFAATASHVGETSLVIVDGVEEGEDGPELIGHAWFQAPDCDGAVHLDITDATVGDVLNVRFVDSFCYELVGEVVE